MKPLTKEKLEELVIILPDGKIKKNTSPRIREKEVGVKFSKEGICFEFRTDGCMNRTARKKRVFTFLTKYQINTIIHLFEVYYLLY